MIDCIGPLLLKQARIHIRVDPYPMSVYLGVLWGDYERWEASLAIPPQEIIDLAESWNKPPNLTKHRHYEQWLARRDDMKERSDRGETYFNIGEVWGVTPARVWQIIHQNEDAPLKVVKAMMDYEEKISPETRNKIIDTVRNKGLSERTQRYINRAINSINGEDDLI